MEGGGKGGNGSGGEVRKVHVIYFLSHMGHVEHPHLIRVHHQSRNGVFLRDVKRWLGDLRGKEMPEGFAWAYKRRYKNGYVWQDLMDDDLITPISDNEYVLKGSQIVQTTNKGHCLYMERKAWVPRSSEAEEKQQSSILNDSFRKSTSSERSSTTQNSTLLNEEEISMLKKSPQPKNQRSSEKKKKSNGDDEVDTAGRPSVSSSTFTNSKSYTNGASQMLRSLMRCSGGGVETNDAALVALNRSDVGVFKGEKIGRSSSTRVFGAPWEDEHQHQHTARESFDGAWSGSKKKDKSEFWKPKVVSVAGKPSIRPFCSQCGKCFKPERMHSHMKSCRGMNAFANSASTSEEKTPLQPQNSNDVEEEEYQ